MLKLPQFVLGQLDIKEFKFVSRVIGEERGLFLLLSQSLETIKINKKVNDTLKVGSWVILQNGQIIRVLQEKNSIKRVKGFDNQTICENVDQMWIVTSANNDINLNRLERYINMAENDEVKPVIVLTKIDLLSNDELRKVENEINDRLNNVQVLPVGILQGLNCQKVNEELKPNETIILMGSSGVGKSTLINYILEVEKQKTQSVRDDDKGRHTTTNRRMFYLPNGCFIVDNPGIRSVSSYTPPSSDKFKNECHFSNCSHTNEPGCKILEQIKNGDLSEDALRNMKKMERESEFYASRNNFQIMNSRKDKWKKLSKNIKSSKKMTNK